MNRAQKAAWLMVISISTAVVLAAIAVAILYYIFGMSKVAATGLGFLGIAGVGGLGPLIFKKDKGPVTCDERDRLINSRATLASFSASYMVVGLTCMVPFFVLGPKSSVSITWLPFIFGAAGLTGFFVHSLVILIQYGRGIKEKNHE